MYAMLACGKDRTDWARVDAKTEAALDSDIASDRDWGDITAGWFKDAMMSMPLGKQLVPVRLDADVLAWFRAQGPGYQAQLNAVSRAYMRSMHASGGELSGVEGWK